jgi:hypothetical protein
MASSSFLKNPKLQYLKTDVKYFQLIPNFTNSTENDRDNSDIQEKPSYSFFDNNSMLPILISITAISLILFALYCLFAPVKSFISRQCEAYKAWAKERERLAVLRLKEQRRRERKALKRKATHEIDTILASENTEATIL